MCWLPGKTRLLHTDEEVQWHAPANRIAAACLLGTQGKKATNGRKRQTVYMCVCVTNLPWASRKSVCLILLEGVFATNHRLHVLFFRVCFLATRVTCRAFRHIVERDRGGVPERRAVTQCHGVRHLFDPENLPTHVICEEKERKTLDFAVCAVHINAAAERFVLRLMDFAVI